MTEQPTREVVFIPTDDLEMLVSTIAKARLALGDDLPVRFLRDLAGRMRLTGEVGAGLEIEGFAARIERARQILSAYGKGADGD